MPTTASYGATGDKYVDGVLSGIKWGVTSLSFSFPTSSSFYGSNYGSGEPGKGFEAFTPAQQDAVRAVLNNYSAVSNLSFSEVIESSSVHADLRYAESDATSTAWAYYPSTSALGGDAWFNNSKNYYDVPNKGSYGYSTMLHETGHALGLKHPHEAKSGFNAMPIERDSLEYTVMSYRAYTGASTTTGYTAGSTSYPQTLMMYDIAAIQKMYGANYSTNAGNTVYGWNPNTGEMTINGVAQGAPNGNKVFMTLWDGGGNDTYDLSNYAGGVSVDLSPGGWTTTSYTQLANLGSGKVAIGNIANALLFNGNTASLIENAIGGAGADRLTGNSADNKLTGNGGNDTLDGGAGTDTAVYSGRSGDYSWLRGSDGSWTVSDLRAGTPDGVDKLINMEWLQFSDSSVSLGGTTTTTTAPPPPVVTTPVVMPNIAPVAANDAYATGKNSKLVVSASSGVLKNDIDGDGDAMSVSLVKGPSKGSLSLKADGSFTYSPSKNYTGTQSFTYQVKDTDGAISKATVSISVGSSSSSKGRGAESIWDDQVPAPRTEKSGHDWVAQVLQQYTSKAEAWSYGQNATQSGIAKLLAALDEVPTGAHDGHGHGGSDSGQDASLKAYYSEFVLF